uniref:BTB domain-containing protein n=1 Tax=Angiostrongylus cantonensis TaxID=6313 RepID=A0A0K0DE55_ANGCA
MFASREVLYFSSPFFREFFNGTGREAEKVEFFDVAVEAAKTVIAYMVTSTFSAPASISPSLAKEIYNLANRLDVMQLSGLMVAVERLSYLNVIEHNEEMNVLIEWFLTAHECHMNRLQNAAVAYLTTYHQRQYITEYGDREIPNPRPPSERLNRGHGGFRTTPHAKNHTKAISATNLECPVQCEQCPRSSHGDDMIIDLEVFRKSKRFTFSSQDIGEELRPPTNALYMMWSCRWQLMAAFCA